MKQRCVNQMPDAFDDATKVMKSHILAANVPTRIDVPVGQNNVVANDLSVTRLQRGRPLDSKRFSSSKEEEYGITELLHSQSITDACQKHDSHRMDTRPRNDNLRAWEY